MPTARGSRSYFQLTRALSRSACRPAQLVAAAGLFTAKYSPPFGAVHQPSASRLGPQSHPGRTRKAEPHVNSDTWDGGVRKQRDATTPPTGTGSLPRTQVNIVEPLYLPIPTNGNQVQ
jgi:hypothetical protein